MEEDLLNSDDLKDTDEEADEDEKVSEKQDENNSTILDDINNHVPATEIDVDLPKVSAKGKNKKNKNKGKKGKAQTNTTNELQCAVCQDEFQSKNKLFAHLKESGHSVALKS